MPLAVPAARLPHPLCTVPLLLGVAQLLVTKLGPRTVLMVFVKELVIPDPPPYPYPFGFRKRNLVSGGGVADEPGQHQASQFRAF